MMATIFFPLWCQKMFSLRLQSPNQKRRRCCLKISFPFALEIITARHWLNDALSHFNWSTQKKAIEFFFIMSNNLNDARQLQPSMSFRFWWKWAVEQFRNGNSSIIFISCGSSRLKKSRWIIMHHLKIMKIASNLWHERKSEWQEEIVVCGRIFW